MDLSTEDTLSTVMYAKLGTVGKLSMKGHILGRRHASKAKELGMFCCAFPFVETLKKS